MLALPFTGTVRTTFPDGSTSSNAVPGNVLASVIRTPSAAGLGDTVMAFTLNSTGSGTPMAATVILSKPDSRPIEQTSYVQTSATPTAISACR